MKRKILSLLLVLAMVMTTFPLTAFAAGNDFDVDLVVSKNDTVKYLDKDTVQVDFTLQTSNGEAVTSIQTAVIYVNLNKFDVLMKNGANGNAYVFANEKTTYEDQTQAFAYSVYSFDLMSTFTGNTVFYKDGNTGLISLNPNWGGMSAVSFTERTSMMSILLGLKDGVTWSDINTGDIRLAREGEVSDMNAKGIVTVNHDQTEYVYGDPDSEVNTLTTAPELIWNVTGIAKAPYSGDAPTLVENRFVLNGNTATVVANVPFGESAEYAITTTEGTTGLSWTSIGEFDGLRPGTYYVYAKVAENAEHAEGDATLIKTFTIYEELTLAYTNPEAGTLIYDTEITPITPVVGGGAGINSTGAYALTGTLPEGLNFSADTGIISGTPSKISATTTVSVTVTDKEAKTASATITFPAVSKKKNAVEFGVAPESFVVTQTVSFEASAISGTVTYQYKLKEEDDSKYTAEVPKTPGNYVVKASVAESDKYKAAEATHNFTIIPQSVDSIEITAGPTKTQYFEGDALDLIGLEVKVTYNDMSTETMGKDDVSVTGFDTNKIGTQTLTATYGGKTATFTVNVMKVELTGIAVTKAPNKTAYNSFMVFDKEGMVVTATYNNSNKEDITDKCEVTYPNGKGFFRVTDQYVTLTYMEDGITKTVTQNVEVTPASVDLSGMSWTYAGPFTYDGNEKTIELQNIPEEIVVDTYEAHSKTYAGVYTAKATFKIADSNNVNDYILPEPAQCMWVIKAAEQTLTVDTDIPKTLMVGHTLDIADYVDSNADNAVITYGFTGKGFTYEDSKLTATAASGTVTVKVNSEAVNVDNELDHEYNAASEQTITIKLVDKTEVEITGVSAATGLEYTGQAQQGYIGTPSNSNGYTGDYEISYNTADGRAPTAAGTYQVTFKVPEGVANFKGSKTLTFTIEKQSVEVPAVSGTYTYSAEAQSVVLTGADETIMTIEGTQTATDKGEYTVTATLSEPANYKWADESIDAKTINWSIAAKEVIITPDAVSKVYQAADPELTYKTNLTGALAEAFKPEGKLTREEGTFVGKYPISLGTLSANNNFDVKLASDTVYLTITPAAQIITIPTAEYHVKIGQQLNLFGKATSNATGANIIYSILTGNDLATLNGTELKTGTNVGKVTIAVNSAAVNVDNAGDAEYTAAEQKTFDVSIDNKDVVTITGPSAVTGLEYNGKAPEKVYEGAPANENGYTGNYDITYVGVAPTVYAESTEVPVNAGTYKVIFRVPADNTYYTGSLEVQFSIAPQKVDSPTVTGSYTYNKAEQSAVVTGVNADMIQSGTASATDAGTYTVTVALKDKTNYVWSDGTTADKTYDWTIAAAKLDKPVLSGTYTYSAAAQSVTVEGFDSNTMTKSGDAETNAGNYTVTVKLADKANYTWADGSIADITLPWSIAAKAVTVTPVAAEKTYGAADPTLTYTTGLTGDLATAFNAAKTGSLTRATGEFAGEYAIGLGSVAAGNNFTVALDASTVNFTIEAAEQTITVPAEAVPLKVGKSVDLKTLVSSNAGDMNAFTFEKSGKGATLTGSTLKADDDNGTITITVKAAAVNKGGSEDVEYKAAADKTFEIKLTEKDSVTITGTAKAEGLKYTGQPQAGYTGTPANSDGYTGTYEVSYAGTDGTTYGPTATPPTEVGKYTVVIKVPDADADYAGNISYTFEIAKAELAAPTVSGKLTYSEAEQTLSLNGFDADKMTVSGNTATAAGSYTATVTLKDEAKASYKWTGTEADSVTVDWAIAKAKVSGAPSTQKITEKGKTLADVKLEVGSLGVEGTLAWDVSETTEVTQGTSYTWTFTPNDADNYEVLTGSVTPWPAPAPSNGGGALPSKPADNVTNDKGSATEAPSTNADMSQSTTMKGNETTTVVDQTTADKIVDKAVENKSEEIVIDATFKTPQAAQSTKAAEVAIPTETMEAIAEKTEADVTIKTDVAEIKLDNAAAGAIAEQAEGSSINVAVEKVNESAKEVRFELTVTCSDGNVISDFKGGNVTITVNIPNALKGKNLVCVYFDENGQAKEVEGYMNGDKFVFTTGHFATCALMTEEDAAEAIARTEKIKAGVEQTTIKLKSSLTKKGSVKLTWTKSKGYKVDCYEVFRSIKRNSGYSKKPFFVTASGNKTTYINTKSLKPGKTYYYKVRGVRMLAGEKVYTQYSNKAWRTVK